MLVITRRPTESIVVNKELTITVVSVDKNQVRIGFEAPRDYEILREELVQEELVVERGKNSE
jgi:carbon storage regulator